MRLPSPPPTAPDVRTALTFLEVPDCGCSLRRSPQTGKILLCRHLTAFCRRSLLRAFPLSIDEWADLLAELDRAEYLEPLTRGPGALALSREARVAVYAARVAAGQSPWNNLDSWRGDHMDAVGVASHRRLNGTKTQDGIATTRAAR